MAQVKTAAGAPVPWKLKGPWRRDITIKNHLIRENKCLLKIKNNVTDNGVRGK